MSIRVRLVILFSLCSIAALAFFGFIAYDSASRDSDKQETALLRQALAPLAPQLASAIRTGRGVGAVLARWTGEYHDRLAVFVTDREGTVLHASPNYRRFADAERTLIADHPWRAVWLSLPLASTGMTAHIGFKSNHGTTLSYLQHMRRSLILAALILVWVAVWAAIYVSGLIEKLHEQKEALRHQATHDPLTDLANRSLLCQRLNEAVSRSASRSRAFALCFVDLDRFKEVNDTKGHLCGDKLLVTVGARLQRIIRRRDTVARLGGDEFAVLLHDVDRLETQAVVEKIIRSIEEDILIDDNAYSISCSVGIALYPDHGDDPQTLLMHADTAMYVAKGRGLTCQFFEAGLVVDGFPPSGTLCRPVCNMQGGRA